MTQKSLGKTPSRQINPALHSTLQTTLLTAAYTRPCYTYPATLNPATPTLPHLLQSSLHTTLPHLLCRARPCHTYSAAPTAIKPTLDPATPIQSYLPCRAYPISLASLGSGNRHRNQHRSERSPQGDL
jgi:hypothetical protein